MAARQPAADAVAEPREGSDLLQPVYRVTATLRWLLLAYTVGANVQRLHLAAHPAWLVAACVAMSVWTVVVGRWQSKPSSRTAGHMVADLVVVVALVLSSRPILGDAALDRSHMTVPAVWTAVSPLVLAVWRGSWCGLAGAVAMGAAVVSQQADSDDRTWTSLVVMGVATWGVGEIVKTLRDTIAAREESYARAAALAERDRMGRIVHDGALQVLAMVEREGPELGPRGEHLATLAHTQEVQLRKLLQDREVEPVASTEGDELDLVGLLQAHEGQRVTVSVVPGRLPLPRGLAVELDAAVREALTNVERHAGPRAHAWVLLEDEPGEVVVTVRDDGVGASAEDIGAAAAQGRFGVQSSIRERIGALGGSARLDARPGRGVEWELRVPRSTQA